MNPSSTSITIPIHTTHSELTQQFNNNATLSNVLTTTQRILSDASVEEVTLSTVHLVSHSLDLPWSTGFSSLLTQLEGGSKDLDDILVSPEEVTKLCNLLLRRLNKEPIPYILQQWDFYNMTVGVKSPCLIPRPETEELVEAVIEDINYTNNTESDDVVRVLDVGCGSGVIGLAINNKISNSIVTCMDCHSDAVLLTRENVLRVLGRDHDRNRFKVVHSSVKEYKCDSDEKYNVIVSNPPYVSSEDMEDISESSKLYEDYNAICGGVDGMDVIGDLIGRLPEWLVEGGVCYMEVDEGQVQVIQNILEGDQKVEFVRGWKDLSGRDRFVMLRLRNKSKDTG